MPGTGLHNYSQLCRVAWTLMIDDPAMMTWAAPIQTGQQLPLGPARSKNETAQTPELPGTCTPCMCRVQLQAPDSMPVIVSSDPGVQPGGCAAGVQLHGRCQRKSAFVTRGGSGPARPRSNKPR